MGVLLVVKLRADILKVTYERLPLLSQFKLTTHQNERLFVHLWLQFRPTFRRIVICLNGAHCLFLKKKQVVAFFLKTVLHLLYVPLR